MADEDAGGATRRTSIFNLWLQPDWLTTNLFPPATVSTRKPPVMNGNVRVLVVRHGTIFGGFTGQKKRKGRVHHASVRSDPGCFCARLTLPPPFPLNHHPNDRAPRYLRDTGQAVGRKVLVYCARLGFIGCDTMQTMYHHPRISITQMLHVESETCITGPGVGEL